MTKDYNMLKNNISNKLNIQPKNYQINKNNSEIKKIGKENVQIYRILYMI